MAVGCGDTRELEWKQGSGYRWAEVTPGYFGSTGFSSLDPASTEIDFKNVVSDADVKNNRNYLNGSGVAAADVDNDGLVDLYFGQLNGPNKLYKNMGGWQFRDITGEAGLALEEYNTTGVVFADVDGDGDPDLLQTSLTERNELFLNDGTGHFEISRQSGLGESLGSNTMALSDIDGDGDLDLYVTNYKTKTVRDIYTRQELAFENTLEKQGDSLVVLPPFDQYYGIIQTDGRSYMNEYGERDELYLNDGSGRFEKVEDTGSRFLNFDGTPMGLQRDWGLTARFQDLNGDGRPDLYVANDFWTPDRIWINQGEGVFRAINRNAIRNMSFSSMGVDFSDIDRDGFTDIFVTEMLSSDHARRSRQLSDHLDPIDGRPQYNKNTLYLNRGDDTFAEIAYFAGVEASEWSWATKFLDIDLDGYEDLLITTGNGNDYQDMDTQLERQRQDRMKARAAGDITDYPVLELSNMMFRNNGDRTFTDMSSDWGFGEQDISLGMAVADLDNDGDPDVAVNRLNRVAAMFENNSNAARITVRLVGNGHNTRGIGARVILEGGPVRQEKEMTAGGDYVSGSQQMIWFAAKPGSGEHRLYVQWPDGQTTAIDNVRANAVYEIDQPDSSPDNNTGVRAAQKTDPLFTDVSDRLGHLHHEDPYNDFNVQSLLPRKVSRQGPGVSWIDFDRDGDEDLFVSSGKGGEMGVFRNNGDGRFEPVDLNGLTDPAAGDQTTVVGWSSREQVTLIVGSSNFEQGNANAPSAYQYAVDGEQLVSEQSIPGLLSTTGPVTAADYDGDGDIDLFVGGNFNPPRYPEDASSRLLVNENGSFVLDQVNSRKLRSVGLVSGAAFSDFDRDGDQDLLLSLEWDSLVLLENRGGNFTDISAETGLDRYHGWWNGVTTGDFNNDGRPDIVATNIGQNSVYQIKGEEPLKLFYEDFNMDGTVDMVDSYFDPRESRYVPRRKMYEFDALPYIYRNVSTHRDYGQASLSEIFGQDFNRVASKEINTLSHMIFLNREDGFEAQPLPESVQYSTAFHASVNDFDNDGYEDLFLSQNFFHFPPAVPRQDAGLGALLLGRGNGTFSVTTGEQSGLRIYGDQRGAAVADINGDHKTDLVVSQNGDSTRLFLNSSDTRGIRIRLEGLPGNGNAIGSALRLVYEDGTRGPLREIRTGTGFRSQPGAAQVLGYAKPVEAVVVHWFDGSTTQFEIDEIENEQVISY